jgi:outer membrane protein assembly factor BamB
MESSSTGGRGEDAVYRNASIPPKRTALWIGLVTSAACVFVASVLIAAAVLDDRSAVIDGAALEALKKRLDRDPADEALKIEIRNLDRRIRENFFRRRRLVASGAVLLLGGAVITAACLKWYAFVQADRFRPRVAKKRPGEDFGEADRERRRTLAAIGAAGGILVAALAVSAALSPPGGGRDKLLAEGVGEKDFPAAGSKKTSGPTPLSAGAGGKAEDNWPRFRGPFGTGIAPDKWGPWPEKWDVKSGENVAWVADVPAPGKSSPIVWGDRLFLTGGDARRQVVMCFDAGNGRLLWTAAVSADAAWKRGRDSAIEVFEDTGFAAPTPATDGVRVFATFATGDVACVDFGGNVLWAINRGRPQSAYSLASSLVVRGEAVIWQFDQGGAEENLSRLIALDAGSGRVLWETPRPVPNSWSTPIIARVGERDQIITSADPWVISYDADSGAEVWRANVMDGDVASSPTFSGGVVYVTNDGAKVAAIRADGAGDVSETNIVWTAEDGMPDASSPLCDGKLFMQASGGGRITCYDATVAGPVEGKPVEGKLLWEKDLSDGFWASPSLAGGLVYLPGKSGKVYVFEWTGKGYAEKGVSDMGEPIEASPAFSKGRIYIRTSKRLFCLERRDASAGKR